MAPTRYRLKRLALLLALGNLFSMTCVQNPVGFAEAGFSAAAHTAQTAMGFGMDLLSGAAHLAPGIF